MKVCVKSRKKILRAPRNTMKVVFGPDITDVIVTLDLEVAGVTPHPRRSEEELCCLILILM